MRYKRLISALLLIVAMLFCGCESGFLNSSKAYTVSNIYFDTFIELTTYGEAVPKEAIELCEKYDNLLSVTKKDSDIYKLNKRGKHEVSPETLELIQVALDYCEESEGLFDISVYPLSTLWDFTAENPSLPDEDKRSEAVKAVDYRKIKIEGNTITVPPNGGIDLGGIAKGYIADRIAEIYIANSLSGIINLGGNILTVGSKPFGKTFKIGIKKPFSEGETLYNLELYSGSAVTCGVYERYFTIDEKIYHHILNPKTGYPETNGLDAVTVICQSSTDADALSTTLFLMGEEKAMGYLHSRSDIHAVFIRRDGTVGLSQGLEMNGNTIKIK